MNETKIEKAISLICKLAGVDVEGKIIGYFQNGQYANDVYQAFMNSGHMPPAPGNVKAEIAHEAMPNGTVKELVLRDKLLTEEELEKILEPVSMTQCNYSLVLEEKPKINKAI